MMDNHQIGTVALWAKATLVVALVALVGTSCYAQAFEADDLAAWRTPVFLLAAFGAGAGAVYLAALAMPRLTMWLAVRRHDRAEDRAHNVAEATHWIDLTEAEPLRLYERRPAVPQQKTGPRHRAGDEPDAGYGTHDAIVSGCVLLLLALILGPALLVIIFGIIGVLAGRAV